MGRRRNHSFHSRHSYRSCRAIVFQVITLFRRKISCGHFTEPLMTDALHGRAGALHGLFFSLMGITDALVRLSIQNEGQPAIQRGYWAAGTPRWRWLFDGLFELVCCTHNLSLRPQTSTTPTKKQNTTSMPLLPKRFFDATFFHFSQVSSGVVSVRRYGASMYREIFSGFSEAYHRQEVVGALITHCGAGSELETDSALSALSALASPRYCC